LLGLTLGAGAGEAPPGIRTWQAPPRTAAPPTLDGRLDDPCWNQALALTEFHLLGTAAASPAADLPATRALLAWDAQALYVAFDCREPLAATLVTKVSEPDGPVWSDDSVEIFLDPAGTREGFVQIAVNAAGTLMDGIQCGLPGKLDLTWDTGAAVAGNRAAEGWTVELAIPWAGLPLTAPQADWTFHLARNRRVAGQHLTSLSSVLNGFGDVGRFDVLRGINLPERLLSVKAVELGPGFLGTNLARVTVRNAGERVARATAALSWAGTEMATPAGQAQVDVQPGAEAVLELPWERTPADAARQTVLVATVSVGDLRLRRVERRLEPLPEAIGQIAPRVFLMEADRPVVLPVPIRVGEASQRGLVLEWQAFDPSGSLAGRGLTTVRTPEAVVRLYWNRWNAGRYALRFSLRNEATVLAGADTVIRLVKSPWGE